MVDAPRDRVIHNADFHIIETPGWFEGCREGHVAALDLLGFKSQLTFPTTTFGHSLLH